MSVNSIRTLTNLKKAFEVLHVVIPAGVTGILLVTGLKPVPAVIMGLLIGTHIYTFAMVAVALTCFGRPSKQHPRSVAELAWE